MSATVFNHSLDTSATSGVQYQASTVFVNSKNKDLKWDENNKCWKGVKSQDDATAALCLYRTEMFVDLAIKLLKVDGVTAWFIYSLTLRDQSTAAAPQEPSIEDVQKIFASHLDEVKKPLPTGGPGKNIPKTYPSTLFARAIRETYMPVQHNRIGLYTGIRQNEPQVYRERLW